MSPVNLVNLEAASKSYGSTVLLDQVSLGVAAGERVGVVGPNGGGKTTLLRVLTRREPVDAGRVTHTGGLTVVMVDQHAGLPAGASVREAVLGRFAAEHEWASDAEIRAVLVGLGLAGDALAGGPAGGGPGTGSGSGLAGVDLDGSVDRMSGGERRRVVLAAALVCDAELLVLDEPTNHLDVEGVAWLAGHLRSRRGALVVVTHDRWFLDAVCERIWEVGDGQVRSYEGGYAAYVLARAERARQVAAAESRRQNLLRKELAWLRRGPPARTSKPRFRIEAAQTLIADEPPPRDSLQLQTFASRRLGKTVYDVEQVSLRVGGRTLLDQVNWRLGPGDRVGVVGVNGSGKTSLLRLLVGELHPDRGRVVVGRTVRPAYLSQEVRELPAELRVLEAVEEIGRLTRGGPSEVELSASQLLDRFGFGPRRQWTPVADLSGGERRRLQLLRLLMTQPNVLLLDEPTNDLDIDTLTALEDLLDGWAGTLVVVSHDRYLIERVCDVVVALLGDGQLAMLPGGVEEYLARRPEAAQRGAPARGGSGAGSGTAGSAVPAAQLASVSGAGAGSTSASAPGRPARDLRGARRELGRLERRVAALEARAAELHGEMAARATDYQRIAELDTELRTVLAEREDAETAWLELSEQL